MSTFAVTVNQIDKVWAHPNADRLSLCQVSGFSYQFVTGKDEYKVGDTVLFFPPDALLPEPVITKMGLIGKLSGKNKNRIKTVRLRDQISEGIVARPEVFFTDDSWKTMTADQVTAALGVTKYEPPEIPCHAGKLIHMPNGVAVYDIEGAERYLSVVDVLMDQPVYLSEKMEGTNFWLSILNGEIGIGTHRHEIKPIEGFEHDFFKAARLHKLDDFIRKIEQPGKRVTLRGELCGPGVQSNIYKLKEYTVFAFDIMVDGVYLNAEEFIRVCGENQVKTVPTISIGVTLREFLNGQTIREASNGKSLLADTAREGFVVKPMIEQKHPDIGRLIIKMRSPSYLAKSNL